MGIIIDEANHGHASRSSITWIMKTMCMHQEDAHEEYNFSSIWTMKAVPKAKTMATAAREAPITVCALPDTPVH